jgi:hypothetical protein
VQRLALDVNVLVHAHQPGLIVEIEALIRSLSDHAVIERQMYHQDAARTGLLPLLDRWRAQGLLHGPVDYRTLSGADPLFRRIGSERPRLRLSRPDLATLVLAMTLDGTAIFTGERALTVAARGRRVLVLDLFDVVRAGLHAGRLSMAQAREMCAEWDRSPFSAGRPIDYSGSFDDELRIREERRPLLS